ncbi:MAG: YHYH protein [Gemmatimonadaceae bacterium]
MNTRALLRRTFDRVRRLPAGAVLLGAGIGCGGGEAASAPSSGGTPTLPPTASFVITSSDAANRVLPFTYTCDGDAKSPPLAWSGAPAGTTQFALLMTTIPSQGSTKYNWVLYGIPSGTVSIPVGTSVGTVGQADDGAGTNYAPPCSQGPGAKEYTFTLYALSSAPSLDGANPAQVTGATLVNAIADRTLAKATLTVTVNRTVAMINCGYVRNSVAAYRTATAVDVTCDSTYAAISTLGIQSRHAMMTGIRATNQQVPVPQNFTGTNAWRIPLTPVVAGTKVSAVDGPIGIAVNGVPIFNPCTQGGCSGPGGGDTKVLGELDTCNGHAGRADDYHYHAAPICMMSDQNAAYWDTHPLGWALDGYAIFGYRNPDGTTAPRDAVCGGNTVTHPNAPAGYAYHVTEVSPYILSCFFGVPSPDLAGQGGKYQPLRPPGTPMPSTNMTLDATAASLAIGGTSTMRWQNGAAAYQIRYTRTSAACWTFSFVTNGAETSSANYCRSR